MGATHVDLLTTAAISHFAIAAAASVSRRLLGLLTRFANCCHEIHFRHLQLQPQYVAAYSVCAAALLALVIAAVVVRSPPASPYLKKKTVHHFFFLHFIVMPPDDSEIRPGPSA